MLLKKARLSLLAIAAAMFSPAAFADPLAARTLVVYASNSPDSVAVKDHYIAARAITNTCPITLPDITAARLSQADYVTYIRNPVRSCLNAAGPANILYIVLAYVRPYALDTNSFSYAIDSYLADIWDQYSTQNFNPVPTATHRYYAPNQSLGNFYLPFQSFQAFRATARASLIYSVWRLDGATKDVAKGLVDKATAAAMNGLTGAACIDRNRGDISGLPDSGYGQGEWDLRRASIFFGQANFAVTEDQQENEFGTSPAPLKCPADGSPVAFFSGWYSLNNYNGLGVFTFAPGAVGIHLDSSAAIDPRSGTNWVANALKEGITVTAGAMAEPYLEGIPRPGGVARNLLEGANVGDAFLRNTRWIKWMILNVGDPLYRPFPTGLAPFNTGAVQDSLYLALTDVVGGRGTTGTVNLATVAPVGGQTISLSSSITAVSVPASVLVPENAKSVSFPITTSAVSATASSFITASFETKTLQNTLTVNPLLGGLGLSSGRVSAGASLTGAVFLNGSAPAGGAVIALVSTDTSLATVPSTVTVPAGIGRFNFPIATSQVATAKTVKIQATYAGNMVETTLNVLPAFVRVGFDSATVNSGGFAVFNFTLSNPAPAGGALVTVTSNSAVAPLPSNQVVVPAGQTYGQIGFTVGTGPATATITATYGGDSRSATLTIN